MQPEQLARLRGVAEGLPAKFQAMQEELSRVLTAESAATPAPGRNNGLKVAVEVHKKKKTHRSNRNDRFAKKAKKPQYSSDDRPQYSSDDRKAG